MVHSTPLLILPAMLSYALTAALSKADCLIVPMFEGTPSKDTLALDKELGGVISKLIAMKDFEGKKLQMSFIYTEHKAVPRILLVGLGKKEELTVLRYKQAVGATIIALKQKKHSRVSIHLPLEAIKKLGAKRLGQETAIAALTANYAFDQFKQKEDRVKPIEALQTITHAGEAQKQAIVLGMKEGVVIAEAVNAVRHLGNTPPSIMTPSQLAKETQKLLAPHARVHVKVLSKPEIKKLGMGCLLGVSQGSNEEPKFIIIEYRGGKKGEAPTVLVGKGITFDSGGLSLKPGDYMPDMKFDMLGAATVLGSMKAAAALGLKKNVVGLMPACENMPSGSAYRPDDILIAMNGKSVEIANTDAEGRLILADALCYAAKYKPKEVIDFATLTGACLVAIGNERSGLFIGDDAVGKRLLTASEQAGEQLWPLPLGDEFSEGNKSEVADIKNLGSVGGPRFGGASTAAAFLQFFTDYPWAHIDLSCSYWGGKGKPWMHTGANGFGVQTMVEYLR